VAAAASHRSSTVFTGRTTVRGLGGAAADDGEEHRGSE
jgi:hypothetical protein